MIYKIASRHKIVRAGSPGVGAINFRAGKKVFATQARRYEVKILENSHVLFLDYLSVSEALQLCNVGIAFRN